MRRITTESSIWLLDESKSLYHRQPREDVGRAALSHRVVDWEWLSYVSVEIVDHDHAPGFQRLHIMAPDSTLGVFSGPILEDVEE
jgi:hypothetical protein